MFNDQDYIFRNKSIFSKEECRFIIDFFESREDLHQVGTSGFGDQKSSDPRLKKCTEIHLTHQHGDIINNHLITSLERYVKLYPFLNELPEWSISSSYKIQKYKPNEGYFKLHCENVGSEVEDQFKRILAWMIYLNDVKDGGYTEFPAQKKKFQPRRGDILIWPAYWTHPHRGVTSKTQTKYIITGWMGLP